LKPHIPRHPRVSAAGLLRTFLLVLLGAFFACRARALDLQPDQDAWALGMGDAAAASAGGTHAALVIDWHHDRGAGMSNDGAFDVEAAGIGGFVLGDVKDATAVFFDR